MPQGMLPEFYDKRFDTIADRPKESDPVRIVTNLIRLYKNNPEGFTTDEVKEIMNYAQAVGIPFEPEFNTLRALRKGAFEAVDTALLGLLPDSWGGETLNSNEEMIGQLGGFLGALIPFTGWAGRITKGASMISKGIKAAETAKTAEAAAKAAQAAKAASEAGMLSKLVNVNKGVNQLAYKIASTEEGARRLMGAARGALYGGLYSQPLELDLGRTIESAAVGGLLGAALPGFTGLTKSEFATINQKNIINAIENAKTPGELNQIKNYINNVMANNPAHAQFISNADDLIAAKFKQMSKAATTDTATKAATGTTSTTTSIPASTPTGATTGSNTGTAGTSTGTTTGTSTKSTPKTKKQTSNAGTQKSKSEFITDKEIEDILSSLRDNKALTEKQVDQIEKFTEVIKKYGKNKKDKYPDNILQSVDEIAIARKRSSNTSSTTTTGTKSSKQTQKSGTIKEENIDQKIMNNWNEMFDKLEGSITPDNASVPSGKSKVKAKDSNVGVSNVQGSNAGVPKAEPNKKPTSKGKKKADNVPDNYDPNIDYVDKIYLSKKFTDENINKVAEVYEKSKLKPGELLSSKFKENDLKIVADQVDKMQTKIANTFWEKFNKATKSNPGKKTMSSEEIKNIVKEAFDEAIEGHRIKGTKLEKVLFKKFSKYVGERYKY